MRPADAEFVQLIEELALARNAAIESSDSEEAQDYLEKVVRLIEEANPDTDQIPTIDLLTAASKSTS